MPPSIPSEYVQGVDEFLATAASIVFGKSNFDNEDLDPILLALDLWEPAEGVSIWLGCHATEGLRKNFDSKVEAVHKSLIRIARTQAYLGRLDHTLQASPRAAKVMTKRVWVFEMYGAELNSFWSTLKKSLNISAKPTPKSEQTPPVVSDSQPPPSETVSSEYQRLWDYAQKMWARGTAKYKICECMKNGPGDYLDCVQLLAPGVNRTDQSRQFHSVVGAINDVVKVELRLEVYKVGQQVLLCEAGQRPARKKPTAKRPTTKKSTTKRKR
jgi:hypothetical protein